MNETEREKRHPVYVLEAFRTFKRSPNERKKLHSSGTCCSSRSKEDEKAYEAARKMEGENWWKEATIEDFINGLYDLYRTD